MIRINLLPHREMLREKRKKQFTTIVMLWLVGGVAVAVLVALGIEGLISAQNERNDFIQRENRELDAQIREIAQLRQEIDSLKARQQAVESLQRDRTLPVHLMDDLVRHTPEGIYFKQLKQEDRKVTLVGISESNERISNLLRELSKETPWLERPELVIIRAVPLGKPEKDKPQRRGFEFAVNATIRAPSAEDGQPVSAPPTGAPAAAGGAAAAPAPAGPAAQR